MKTWRDARSDSEREEILAEALERCGTVAAAARLLEVSTRTLVRFRRRLKTGPRPYRKVETSETGCPASRHVSGKGGRFSPTFTDVRLTLPRHLVEWLERTALEWMHAGRLRRPSKAAVVTALLLGLMAEPRDLAEAADTETAVEVVERR